MKACSFLPAITQMIYDMNLQHLLYGVTHNCPHRARVEKEMVIDSPLTTDGLSNADIDSIYSGRKQEQSLYRVNEFLLQKIAPDLIFTQDLNEGCRIDAQGTLQAVAGLKSKPRIVGLSPSSLEDVFAAAITIATELGEPARGVNYIQDLRSKITMIGQSIKRHQITPKIVLVLEWTDPLYHCGHWIADQVALAGGIDMLSNPSGTGHVLPWEKIRRCNPEVIVVSTGGLRIESTLKEIEILSYLPEWNSLDAVKTGSVYVIDSNLMTQPSASALVHGIEMLASLFHPLYFSFNEHSPQHVRPVSCPIKF